MARGTGLLALALAALAWGLGWQRIAALGTDTPTSVEWTQIGVGQIRPWLETGGTIPLGLQHVHAASAWGTLGLLGLNGQWDPRLAALGAVAMAAGAIALLFALALRERRPETALATSALAGVVLGFPVVVAGVNAPAAFEHGWVALTAAAFLWSQPTDHRGRRRRGLGLAVAALGVLGGTAGAAAPLAVLLGVGWRDAAEGGAGGKRLERRILLGLVVWAAARVGLAGLAGEVAMATDSTVSGGWVWVQELWALAMLAAVGWGRWPQAPRESASVLIARWAACWQVMALVGLTPRDLGGGVHPFVWLATVLAGAHLWDQSDAARRSGTIRLVLAAWTFGAALLLLNAGRDLPSRIELTEDGRSRTLAVRDHLAGSEPAPLATALALGPSAVEQVSALLRDPRFAPWLPASVRAPIRIEPAADGSDGFRADGFPLGLAALPRNFPAWGSGPGGEVTTTARFRSEPFVTSFGTLQVYVAGRYAPAATSLWIEDSEGKVHGPVEGAFTADAAWKRVNLPVGRGPFRLHLQDGSADAWLAVAGPVELGRGTWLAGKLAALAWVPLFLAGLLALAGIALWAKARRTTEAPAPANGVGWPAFTWFAFALYAGLLLTRLDTTAAGSDAAGYLESARLFGEGRIVAPLREVPGFSASSTWLYTPLGYRPFGDEGIVPTYPSGLPLMFTLAGRILPFAAGVGLVIWLHLLAVPIVVRRLAESCGLAAGWAWTAAGLVTLNPVLLYNGIQPMSDVPSLVWVTWAVDSALRSRQRPGWAWVAGIATAVAVLLRPANAIAFVPLLLALPDVRATARWVGGAVPFALWQAGHAWLAFGHPLSTGYGDARVTFALSWLRPTLVHYFEQLTATFTPLIWTAAVAPFLSKPARRLRWLLASWVLLYFGLYAFYFCTHETWWYLRFVLPAYPALIVLGLLTARTWFQAGSSGSSVVSALRSRGVLLLVSGAVGANLLVQIARHPVFEIAEGNRVYVDAANRLKELAPPGSAVFAFQASGALHHYTSYTLLRFDQVEAAENRAVAEALLNAGTPVYAVLFPFDRQVAGARIPAGEWELLARYRDVELLRLRALAP